MILEKRRVYEGKIEVELPYRESTTRTFLYSNEYQYGVPVVKVWLPKAGNIRHPTPTIKVIIDFTEDEVSTNDA